MTARAKLHSLLLFLVFANVAVFLAKHELHGVFDPIMKALGA